MFLNFKHASQNRTPEASVGVVPANSKNEFRKICRNGVWVLVTTKSNSIASKSRKGAQMLCSINADFVSGASSFGVVCFLILTLQL